jgi:hypothetical protein
MKRVNFSSVNISDLEKIVTLNYIENNNIYFKDWFGFKYDFSNDEELFLKGLLEKINFENRFRVGEFSEEEIKIKFIALLLNKISFVGPNYRDWYERPLKAKINSVLFNGLTDFIVADGEFSPTEPYFFIQEFKKSFKANSPIGQILAEMMVALEINQNQNIMRGAFTYGAIWQFIVLEKIDNSSYNYSISKSLDSFEFGDLKTIYKHLKAVKHLYCNK